MADQDEVSGKKQRGSINIEELQAIVNAAVSAALEKTNASNEAIVDALIKAREPYVDPKQKAFDELARRSSKEQFQKQKKQFDQDQVNCPHKKGSSSLSWYNDPNNSSFAIHTLDSTEIIGICTNCTKVISSLNPEDRIFFANARGTNIRSSAGVRNFADPLAAQRGRLAPTKEIFVDEIGHIVDGPEKVLEPM